MKKIVLTFVAGTLLSALWWFTHKPSALTGRRLTLYIYANYLDPTVLEDFKKEYGVDVIEENCSSNEEVEGKLKAGATGYDLIVPSDYMVQRLASAHLIQPLDRTKITNTKYLSPQFQTPNYDPKGEFVVPYMWGTTGIGYNQAKIATIPHSWKDFFDAKWLSSLDKRLSILDDPRELIGAALKASGHSLNEFSPEALADAKAKLQTLLPYVGRIDSNSFKDLLASGDIWVAHGYSGDILRLSKDQPEIKYIIPEDGGSIWADNLAIPTSSSNQDIAYLFIDFIMRPEVNARLATYIHYATTNEAAKAFIPKEQLDNPNIYPDKALLARLEWFQDLGEHSDDLDTLWTELKASVPSLAPASESEE